MAEDRDRTTQAPFEMMDDDGEVDDFFDTAAPDSNPPTYNLSSEQFIFDGDEHAVVVPPTSQYVNNDEPLLPDYLIPSYSRDEVFEEDRWSDDHPMALPLLVEQQQPTGRRRYSELSGLNYLNLCTFLVYLTVSIAIGSGVVERAHPSWLPSTWTVTTLPQYETLLTPIQWAGDYLWIPVLCWEGIFVLVQLLPKVRSGSEVVTGVACSYFHIGMLQSLATLLFCLKWIIPAWVALAGTVASLLWMQAKQEEHQSTTTPHKWKYWVFRFPFDLHIGWLLPLLASRGSMIFRYYCRTQHGLQLAADIVTMALLLPCAGAYLVVRGNNSGPRNWVVPVLILWAYLGIACRLRVQPPVALIDAYGMDVCVAIRDAAWCFAGTVALLLIPQIAIWIAREFLTIHVVQLADDDGEDVGGNEDMLLLRNHASAEPSMSGMTEF
ncbi:expressed unknown protein [Seminavis robusta]|uniref:Uncharacterized protein n=1 Tax=Seminavis robusta TaxID=568900 RepID=A0A9N8DP77_9STRA|nr:expressed unknown protein [Seminavis robusta]|eukprot:Sro189_g081470.1 n/a (437) ;mRNA; r:36206-37516